MIFLSLQFFLFCLDADWMCVLLSGFILHYVIISF